MLKKKTYIILLIFVALTFAALFLFMQNPVFPSKPEGDNKSTTDTMPPVISCDIKTKTLLPGETISIDKLGIRTQDSSEIKSIAFTKITSDNFYTGLSEAEMGDMRIAYQKGIPFYGKELQFAYTGIYELTIEACDSFDNKSETSVTIKVEGAPVIEAPLHFYIAKGSKLIYTEHISAWDFIDEDFSSEDIEIDSSNVNLASVGDYVVTFRATDSYGLSSASTSTIHVLEQDKLQELINTQQIDRSASVILGAYNAYDIGIFESTSLTDVTDALAPVMVRILNPKTESSGNGFIVKIDDTFVTICTAAQVCANCINPEIIFFDDTMRIGAVTAYDNTNDVAFIRIPIDGASEDTSLSLDYVKDLRTIHIDEGHWKKLAAQNSSVTPSSTIPGSAIYDESGRLLGMVGNPTDLRGETFPDGHIPLKEILRRYELTFKKKLQYH